MVPPTRAPATLRSQPTLDATGAPARCPACLSGYGRRADRSGPRWPRCPRSGSASRIPTGSRSHPGKTRCSSWRSPRFSTAWRTRPAEWTTDCRHRSVIDRSISRRHRDNTGRDRRAPLWTRGLGWGEAGFPVLSGSDQLQLARPPDGFVAAGNCELAEDRPDVGLHRVHRDEHGPRDLVRTEERRQVAEHLPLLVGQR